MPARLPARIEQNTVKMIGFSGFAIVPMMPQALARAPKGRRGQAGVGRETAHSQAARDRAQHRNVIWHVADYDIDARCYCKRVHSAGRSYAASLKSRERSQEAEKRV